LPCAGICSTFLIEYSQNNNNKHKAFFPIFPPTSKLQVASRNAEDTTAGQSDEWKVLERSWSMRRVGFLWVVLNITDGIIEGDGRRRKRVERGI
jgi:hypothetical protein